MDVAEDVSEKSTRDAIRVALFSSCRICRDAWRERCRADDRFNLRILTGVRCIGDTDLAGMEIDVAVVSKDAPALAFDFIRDGLRELRSARVILVADEMSDICLRQALLLNIAGILLKHESLEQQLAYVVAVARGQRSFSAEIEARLSYDESTDSYQLRAETPVGSLSKIQLEILRHLAKGDSLKVVATKMGLSRKSVDGHKYRLMNKLGLQDRVLLSRFAIREGFVDA